MTVAFLDALSRRAAASPQRISLSGNNEVLTRSELETRANELAHELCALGVKPDMPVGLFLRRSPSAAAGALGILKAGGAYLPLDPTYPTERIAFMLADAGVSVVVTDSATAPMLPCGAWDVVMFDELGGSSKLQAPPVRIAPEHLAYVIYTSGSTGQPKGVMVTHANLANLIEWHVEGFKISEEDRVSQVSSFGFDAAVWEIWPCLTAGASVHFVDDVSRREPEALRDWMVEQRITAGFVPTALAEHMVGLPWPAGAALRFMLTGADTLHRRVPAGLPFRLINNYGPTECTVVATSATVPAGTANGGLPPIGRPIRNAFAKIVDDNLQPVRDGETGELLIGGAGVARGYLNQPELTARKFITIAGERLYRTGDLARRLPDGQLAFAGRMDDQIKIRGFRIEPGEISAMLGLHAGVRSSVVAAKEDESGEKRLVAYVVGDAEACSEGALRDHMRQRLPAWMIPDDFVHVDRFPLTPNGKIDRKSLPSPVRQSLPASDAASVEIRVREIVRSLLKIDRIGRDDNFFLLGAHSLTGAQMIARIHETFGVRLTLRNLFQAPTVAALVEAIEAKQTSEVAK